MLKIGKPTCEYLGTASERDFGSQKFLMYIKGKLRILSTHKIIRIGQSIFEDSAPKKWGKNQEKI